MTSTFTNNLHLQLQGVNDNNGTWGTVLNTNVIALIDNALGATYAANVAGNSNVTLTTAQAGNLIHNLTGALTGNIQYIFPANTGRLLIINNSTTGAYTVTVLTSGGTGVVAAQGSNTLISLDSSTNTAYNLSASSGLSSSLSSGNIFVGNGSNVATGVAMSGDATLSNTGAITLATVNSTTGSFTNATVTLDGKGRVTSASSGGNGVTVGTTTVSGGTNGYIEYNNGGVLGEKATTGTGSVVLATSPTLVTPALGTPASGNLSNCTNIPAALVTPLAVGSFATLQNNTGSLISAGVATSSASLKPVEFGGGNFQGPTDTIAGTWKPLQTVDNGYVVLWQRTA